MGLGGARRSWTPTDFFYFFNYMWLNLESFRDSKMRDKEERDDNEEDEK